MAYNAVSQADHDLPSDSDDSGRPSPQAHAHSAFFEQNTDHIDGTSHMQPAEAESNVQSLGSMIRSMRAPSYDVVEDDDYEVVADPATGPDFNSPCSPNVSPPRPHAPNTPPTEDRAELRTPTTEHSVPLSHPTPGLQSLQGAYLQNVERLEKTAERLSLSSADIGSEIRRMDLEQRRRSSAGSASIYTSQDGLSHRDSMQSGTRLAQLSEQHALEEFPENRTAQSLAHSYLPPLPDPAPLTAIDINQNAQYQAEVSQTQMERPSSAASGDTYRQARVLFNDFDGVHYVPLDKGLELARQLSLTRPPHAAGAESNKQPQGGKDMVFYPAPVPMMLNLPPKLSQRPDQTEREKRRTQLLNAVAPDNRKSAPWLSEQGPTAGNDRRQTKQLSDLPPHLRASVFFEAPSASLDIDHTQTSAVATLDSILDASTTAPVTAFTDHPFAGPLRPEMYSSAKHGKVPKNVPKDPPRERNKLRRKSALDLVHQSSGSDLRSGSPVAHNLYPSTEAEAAEPHERSSLRRHNSESDSDSSENSEESSESSEGDTDGDNDEQLQFVGQPATLLAELEKRKHDLKQRRRTAANVVGMQSTLLELDAVAAKQSEHRRQKRIALAWETPEAAHHNDEDEDEDVPLGMLFPGKSEAADEARPLGLMEKKEMEEGEPLSRRRARLRGEPLPQIPDRRPMTIYSQTAQSALALNQEDDSGEEGETLGQRLRRLKGHERNVSKADTDFTTELLAEFDHLKEDENKGNQNEPSQEDETLAERRARLKKEALEKRNSGLKIPRYRKSMADIFHAPRPSTAGQRSFLQEVPGPQGLNHQRSFDNRMSMQQFPPGPPNTSAGLSQYQAASMAGPYGYQMAHPNTFYSDAILGNGNLSYAMPSNMHSNNVQQPINPGQRAVIDRWRQSIV